MQAAVAAPRGEGFQTQKIIVGETIFKLYDTYGFPVDLTADIARERGLMLDEAGFEREMNKQREMSKAASKFGSGAQLSIVDMTDFKGYEHLDHPAKIIGLYQNGEAVETIAAGDTAVVILDQTPFYAEAGGQVGDQGYLIFEEGRGRFKVDNTQKAGNAIAHCGHLELGHLTKGMPVDAQVDQENRQAIALNHSATHLLHSALQQLLGKHVEQKGSLVSAQRLRFDFTHNEKVDDVVLRKIE